MAVTADGGQIQAYTHRQPGIITKETAATALSTRSTITDYTVTGRYIIIIFSANMNDDISCLSATAVVIICENGKVGEYAMSTQRRLEVEITCQSQKVNEHTCFSACHPSFLQAI